MFPRIKKFLPLLALAAALFVRPAFAADGPYTVSDIHVDATAASPAEALNAAMAQGRPRAWQILYRRLTRQQDWARQPELDSAALTRLLRDSSIANERRSTTRYVADVTYTFNPEAVNRLLQGAGIAFTQGVAKRILVVPMSPGFQPGPWAQALNAPGLKGSVVPFAVADAADAATLGSLNFDTAAWNDVAAAARRVGASEAALVQAVNASGKLTVNIRRIGLGEAPVKSSLDVPLLQTTLRHLSRRRHRCRSARSKTCGRPAPRLISASAAACWRCPHDVSGTMGRDPDRPGGRRRCHRRDRQCDGYRLCPDFHRLYRQFRAVARYAGQRRVGTGTGAGRELDPGDEWRSIDDAALRLEWPRSSSCRWSRTMR